MVGSGGTCVGAIGTGVGADEVLAKSRRSALQPATAGGNDGSGGTRLKLAAASADGRA